jgi:hypothetical protein
MLAPLYPNSAARGPSIVRKLLCGALLPLFLGAPMHARAGDGFLGIDHELDLDQRGIWARKYQVALEYGVIATEIGGSLWLGNDDELGHTLWQTIDATAISSIAAEGLKFSFSRARPDQGNNPNQWFKGRCCDSFPSGEVTLQASFVTPFIANYARDYPWVWALEALPAYDAHYPAFGADFAARPVGGLLHAVLTRRRTNLTRQRSIGR